MESAYTKFKSKSRFMKVLEDASTMIDPTQQPATVASSPAAGTTTNSTQTANPAVNAAQQATAAVSKAQQTQAQAMINFHNTEMQRWQSMMSGNKQAPGTTQNTTSTGQAVAQAA